MIGYFLHPDHARTRSIAAAIACAAVCGMVFGLSMPLVSLRLEHMTGSGFLVGMNGFAAALSTLVIAPFAPRLMAAMPTRGLLVGSLIGCAVLFSLFAVLPVVWVWFLLRFLSGCCMTAVFVVSETWINQQAPRERRATVLAIYGTVLSGGFGAGAALFSWLGQSGDLGFYACSTIFLLGLLPVLLLRGPAPEAPEPDSATLGAMMRSAKGAPAAIAAGLAFGALETLVFALLAVYGDRIGLEHAALGGMMLAAAAGALVLQLVVGWSADRLGARRMLTLIAASITILPLLGIWAGADLRFLLPIVFLQAGISSGLYTVGLALIGERFTGGAIAAANAAFVFTYGMGSIVGPPAGGITMDAVGPWGFLAVMSAIGAAYLAFLLLRRPDPEAAAAIEADPS